jgi:hypothetical protein
VRLPRLAPTHGAARGNRRLGSSSSFCLPNGKRDSGQRPPLTTTHDVTIWRSTATRPVEASSRSARSGDSPRRSWSFDSERPDDFVGRPAIGSPPRGRRPPPGRATPPIPGYCEASLKPGVARRPRSVPSGLAFCGSVGLVVFRRGFCRFVWRCRGRGRPRGRVWLGRRHRRGGSRSRCWP